MFKEKEIMERGSFQTKVPKKFQTKDYAAAVKWMDNKPVPLLTPSDSPQETATVQRKNKGGTKTDVSCPSCVSTYNTIMRS